MALGKWKRYLGVAGVSPYESKRAKRIGWWFEWLILSLAILITFRWYFEFKGKLSPELIYYFDWLIWSLFVLEAFLLSLCVRDPLKYLRENWLNLLIIVTIFPPLWVYAPVPASLRLIRLLVLVDVFIRMIKILYKFLRQNNLGTTLLSSAIIIIIAGVLISVIDPAFTTPFEGIWWAWVTVSTVGYGDFVPISTTGRVFAILLILLGIGLFALLTAQISAALIGSVGKDIQEVEREVRQLETDEATLHLRLEQMERRLERIERLIEKRLPEIKEKSIDT